MCRRSCRRALDAGFFGGFREPMRGGVRVDGLPGMAVFLAAAAAGEQKHRLMIRARGAQHLHHPSEKRHQSLLFAFAGDQRNGPGLHAHIPPGEAQKLHPTAAGPGAGGPKTPPVRVSFRVQDALQLGFRELPGAEAGGCAASGCAGPGPGTPYPPPRSGARGGCAADPH